MSDKSKRYNIFRNQLKYSGGSELKGLQIIKLICAFLVVQSHIRFGAHEILLPICRVGVPIFLMISGYFLLDGEGYISMNKISKSFFKILKIYIFASCVYFVYQILFIILKGQSLSEFYCNIAYWLRYFFVGDSTSIHLWYLVSILQVYLLILLLLPLYNRIKSFKILYLIISIGLLFNFLFGKYNFLIDFLPNNLLLSRNVFTIGLPCVFIGTFIRCYENRLPSTRIVLSFLVLFITLLYIENDFLENKTESLLGDLNFFTLPCAICIMILSLRINYDNKLSNLLASYGKKYSLDIYIWHLLVYGPIIFLVKQLDMPSISLIVVILVIILTLIISSTFQKIGIKNLYT